MAKIDVIIPAFKAHDTLFRTLCSVAEQTIVKQLSVIVVNDCCPEGSYSEIIAPFKRYMDVIEMETETNGGAGVARQYGIDHSCSPYIAFVDADDTLCGSLALETLLKELERDKTVKVCCGSFCQIGDNGALVPHKSDMVWMFGKLYRRDFIRKYNVHFNGTRANEDTGFNAVIKMLCDNPQEQVKHINELVYYWHGSKDSITRINDCQYTYDQCVCGYIDNMIDAIDHVRRYKPFAGVWLQWSVDVMFNLYHYYVQTVAKAPQFAAQNWEYCKKFYHQTYAKAEPLISDEVFRQMFTANAQGHWGSGDMFGVMPHITIQTFMQKMQTQPYDPRQIYEVWKQMAENPETAHLIANNVKCGVCSEDYWKGGEYEQT